MYHLNTPNPNFTTNNPSIAVSRPINSLTETSPVLTASSLALYYNPPTKSLAFPALACGWHSLLTYNYFPSTFDDPTLSCALPSDGVWLPWTSDPPCTNTGFTNLTCNMTAIASDIERRTIRSEIGYAVLPVVTDADQRFNKW